MVYLSQRDPLWAKDRLGSSSLTMGRYGCTTTCIAMLSDYFKCYMLPSQIAHNVANYTKDGLVIWKNLKFDKMKFVFREYTRNDARIREAVNDPKKAVILQVNNGQHWVVAVRPTWTDKVRNLFSKDYVIVDPWDGKKKNLLASYHNITGAAYFEAK